MIHGSSIIDYYGDKQDSLIPVAGPGHWNDPEIIVNMVILNLSEYSLIVFQNDSLNSFLLHFDRFEHETIDNRSDGFS
jgi:hypothetical protein